MNVAVGPLAFFGTLLFLLLGIKAARWTVRRQMEAYGRAESRQTKTSQEDVDGRS